MFLFLLNLSQTLCPTFSINKFELGFDYSSVPEILCIVPIDFDDFFLPNLKTYFERRAKPNEDKTQIINIGIEEDPNLDRLNIETKEKNLNYLIY